MNAYLEPLALRPGLLHGVLSKTGPELSNPHY
jgi:hypothetical protein